VVPPDFGGRSGECWEKWEGGESEVGEVGAGEAEAVQAFAQAALLEEVALEAEQFVGR